MADTATIPRPKFRDYAEAGAPYGAGRRTFRRLRRAGAFDEGSSLRTYNPFLEEGQEAWKSDPFQRFIGPARQRFNVRNLGSAIHDLQAADRVKSEEAYRAMMEQIMGGQETLQAQATAARTALETPPISAEQLRQMQAVARERIAREGGTRRGALSATLAGQGQRVDDANAAYAASEGDTLYRLGQAEIEQGIEGATRNRDALIQAIQAASGYGANLSQTIDNLLAVEGFRQSLTQDQVNALLALKGLQAASS